MLTKGYGDQAFPDAGGTGEFFRTKPNTSLEVSAEEFRRNQEAINVAMGEIATPVRST
jgi:hypothetical protein